MSKKKKREEKSHEYHALQHPEMYIVPKKKRLKMDSSKDDRRLFQTELEPPKEVVQPDQKVVPFPSASSSLRPTG